jgi:protein-S-isoprenylcysteine O-methyltransferase Ste14
MLIALPSFLFALWAMVVNTHFEATVRIQEEREHQVCSSGPYEIVRHPGYVSMILLAFANPLILGSRWAFAPAGLIVLLVLARTALEDRTLQDELLGYKEYAASTRYRLLPGVW